MITVPLSCHVDLESNEGMRSPNEVWAPAGRAPPAIEQDEGGQQADEAEPSAARRIGEDCTSGRLPRSRVVPAAAAWRDQLGSSFSDAEFMQ